MNDQDDPIIETLRRLIPEPPGSIDPANVGAGSIADPRRRSVLAVGAAAVVAFVALAAVLVANTRHHDSGSPAASSATAPDSHHAAGPSAVTSSATSVSSTPTHPTHPASPAFTNWTSTVLSEGSYEDWSLVASATDLYAVDGTWIDRIDPATGAVINRAASPVPHQSVSPSTRDGRVWFAATTDHHLLLYRYADSLRHRSIVTVSSSAPKYPSPLIAANATSRALYVSDGSALYSVQANTLDVTRLKYQPQGQISAIALSPDGGTLYIASQLTQFAGQLGAYDISTGTVHTVASHLIVGGDGVVPSEAGVWSITTAGGHGAGIVYEPTGGHERDHIEGDGTGISLSVTGSVAWVSLIGEFSCYNSDTGTRLATTKIKPRQAVVGPVATIDNQYFAVLRDEHPKLVRFTPPAACRGADTEASSAPASRSASTSTSAAG